MNSKFSNLKNKVALITGGSKGLGVVLAEHLIKEKCKIAICARDEEELEHAKMHLEEMGGEVFIHRCDISEQEQAHKFIDSTLKHFGRLDVVINNAGIIQVGPMETFEHKDYKKAMNIMFWGMVNVTLAALPHLKSQKEGHIVNITSVGGKVSIPHLLPYSAAKFAAVGFSEGLAAELRKDNIFVTTIVPGLMRTGSYVNAYFQEGNLKEFKLFSFIATAPFLTLSADKVAQRVIRAVKKKKSYKVIGLPAKILIELHHSFPNLLVKFFSQVSQAIPAEPKKAPLERGNSIRKRFKDAEVPGARIIGEKIRREHQELKH